MNPNDPYYYDKQWGWNQWALVHLGAPVAWDCIDTSAAEVAVAVVDKGVARNHEDLNGRLLLPTHSVIDSEREDDDHGTLIAGTIGAAANNARGIAGAAGPAKIGILSIKFCSQQVLPSPENGAHGINKAVTLLRKHKRKGVICLPWDVGYDTRALGKAIADAGKKGTDAIVVIAAGNSGLDNDKFPNWPANHGDMDHVITVMATGLPTGTFKYDEERATYSNYGRKTVHIAAPGDSILSTAPYYGPRAKGDSIRTGYRYFRGTSAATALVAALAALIRAKNPSWTAAWVKDHLIASAVRLPALKGLCVSGGIAHFGRAVCGKSGGPN